MTINSIGQPGKTLSTSVPARRHPLLLTPAELTEHPTPFQIVDVQNPRYLTHHLPAAQRLTEAQILREIPKEQPLLVTCLVGDRSLKIAHRLIRSGYRQVYVLQGGIVAWRNAGYRLQRYSP